MTASFARELRRRIETDGPITVAVYMQACVTHYYAGRDPLGARGDFITAPEISQMFGELIGMWCAALWRMMGEPTALNLVELGPGRGTLMADLLRAAGVLPPFKRALAVHLVETSPALRERQRDRLRDCGNAVSWHETPAQVPDAPALWLANEFFDALPVHQAVRAADGWHARTVELVAGELRFGMAPQICDELVPVALHDAPNGALVEWRDPEPMQALAARVTRGGAALIIDYGHIRSAVGDTLQALRAHAYADPLLDPGAADLTAHVDFAALAAISASAGARVHGPLEQAAFLRRLGIAERAAVLKRSASAAQVHDVDAALDRLTATTPAGMGRLFKVLAVADPRLGPLPAFDA